MYRSLLVLAGTATLSALACAAQQPAADPNDVLAWNAEATMTRGDYENELKRLPAEQRGVFGTNPKRVEALLNKIFLHKVLAAQARARGLDKDPEIQALPPYEQQEALVVKRVAQIEADAGAEYDARGEQNMAIAREDYLARRETYRDPETFEVSDILFAIDKRGQKGALDAARETRVKLMSGFDFAAMGKSVSDNPETRAHGGRLPKLTIEDMRKIDRSYAQAVSALTKPGEISQPVETEKGYHLIRLDAHNPSRQLTMDEALERITAYNRLNYIEKRRDAILTAIRGDPTIKVNQAAIDSLVVYVDPEGFKPKLPAPDASTTK